MKNETERAMNDMKPWTWLMEERENWGDYRRVGGVMNLYRSAMYETLGFYWGLNRVFRINCISGSSIRPGFKPPAFDDLVWKKNNKK